MECVCIQTRPRFYTHPKEGFCLEGGGRGESEPTLTPKDESPLPLVKKNSGGSNQRLCIKQDSEPNTLPTSYSGLRVKHLQLTRRSIRSGQAHGDRLVGLVVKASASKAEDPRFESHLRRDFFEVVVPVNNRHSSGYPVRRLE